MKSLKLAATACLSITSMGWTSSSIPAQTLAENLSANPSLNSQALSARSRQFVRWSGGTSQLAVEQLREETLLKDPSLLKNSTRHFPESLKKQVDAAAAHFKLSMYNARYILAMAAQYLRPDDPNQQLQIVTPTTPNGNYRLAVRMDAYDRKSVMAEVPLSEINKNPEHLQRARHYHFTWDLLHGGIGENVGRILWLAKQQGKSVSDIRLGAKGTDLGYFVLINNHSFFISAAELQLCRALDYVNPNQRQVGGLTLEPIVNGGSAPSFKKLLDSPFLDDRIAGIRSTRTYRQVMNEYGLSLNEKVGDSGFLWQADLPGIHVTQEYVKGGNGEIQRNIEGDIPADDNAYMQTGGHGQLALYFIYKAKEEAPSVDGFGGHFRVFGNGDNSNASLYPQVADYMKQERIVVMQVNTKATPTDRKGGKVGARRVADQKTWRHFWSHLTSLGGLRRILNGTWSQVWVPDMMELGQAKAADRFGDGHSQQDAFYEAGQQPGENQPFNTNSFVINSDALHDLMVDMANELGEEEFLQIIAPTLVVKPPKPGRDKTSLYVPIDGSIGSVMHNINAWFMTDPRAEAILKKNKLARFLAYLDAPRDGFAPVKSVWDQYMQANTDAYRVDVHKRELIADPRFQFPEVEIQSLNSNKKDDGYWGEYQTMIDSFGRLEIVNLNGLYISGQVKMQNARLAGMVRIENRSGVLANLKDPRFKVILEKENILQSGQLVIEDKKIIIGQDGQLTIDSIFSPPAVVTPAARTPDLKENKTPNSSEKFSTAA